MSYCTAAHLAANSPCGPATERGSELPSEMGAWQQLSCALSPSLDREISAEVRGEELSSATGIRLEKGCASRFSLCEDINASSGPAALDNVLL